MMRTADRCGGKLCRDAMQCHATEHAMQPWDSQTAALAICALNHLIAFSCRLLPLGYRSLLSFDARLVVAMAKFLLDSMCISAALHC